MRRLKIVLHQSAVSDLEEIWLYTFQQWSSEQADRYHTLIQKEIEYLAIKPNSGKNMGHIRDGYRASKV